MVVEVYCEVGQRRVFASARDWPGWCRAGKGGEEAALATLAEYAPRYAPVARRAGLDPPVPDELTVVERVPGDASTDFGAPGKVVDRDRDPLDAAEAERQAALVAAAWEILDEVAAETPAELRKGPRGGGRDRDRMIDHVQAAEASYARKIGVRHSPPALHDREAVAALRADVLAVLRQPSDGSPPPTGGKGWPPRYAARRIAWHVLDHVWEMQDRS